MIQFNDRPYLASFIFIEVNIQMMEISTEEITLTQKLY